MASLQDVLRAVIDSNAVDRMPEHQDALHAGVTAGLLDLLWTHVTVDELAAIKDVERRALLLNVAIALCRWVPTGAFVVDVSRLGMARLYDDTEAFAAHRLGNVKHTADALIAVTAEVEGAAVVTYDGPMRSRAEARGLTVYNWSELLAAVDPG